MTIKLPMLSKSCKHWSLVYTLCFCAQMQSGKTGTFLYSACNWAYEDKPIVIVTASRSIKLREQYEKDKEEAIKCYAKICLMVILNIFLKYKKS